MIKKLNKHKKLIQIKNIKSSLIKKIKHNFNK